MAHQHQRWLAYKFSLDLIDMKKPDPIELLSEACIDGKVQAPLFRALLRAIKCRYVPHQLEIQYFRSVRYQGFRYSVGVDCNVAWQFGSSPMHGKLQQIIKIACEPAPLWVFVLKRLCVVSAVVQEINGWQLVLNIVKEGTSAFANSNKLMAICLEHVPVRPVKLCMVATDAKAIFDY
jgi:hypothetical protein